MSKQAYINKAVSLFNEGYTCSQSILLTFIDKFEVDEKTAKLIASTFGGGMGRLRQKCGALTGGFMVLGLAFGNVNPNDLKTKLNAYQKVRELNKLIEEIYGTTNCGELLKKHATSEQVINREHHQIICKKVVADVAAIIFDKINF